MEITSEERQIILDYLDYCYKTFEQMGFDQSFQRKNGIELMGETLVEPPNWPLDIYIKEFGFFDKEVAGYWYENRTKTDGWIEINSLVMRGTDNEVWSAIIHEYFHFVQFLYNSDNIWFDEATATWAEEFGLRKEGEAVNPGNYRKYGTEGFQVLDGPINHSKRSAREHGYGSWAFVKYLVMTPAQGGELVKVYDNIASYKSEVEILNAIRPVREWINQFYITLLTPEGPVAGIPYATFRLQETNTPVVTVSLADTGQAPRQTVTIPGLGARVVLVRLDAANADITDGTSLEVRANNEDLTVNLIRMAKFEVLASSKDAASTAKVADLAKDSRPQQVLVLVTNTSEQTATCELGFAVQKQKEYETWLLEHRTLGRTEEGGWLGPQALLYRNAQGQYYKIEKVRTAGNVELTLKIEGNQVTIIDDDGSTYYDAYEGVFSADGKSIVGKMRKIQKNSDNPRIIVYEFRATRVEE